MNEFNVLLGAATNGTPSGSLFDALFARYIAPQESWRELESPLPITILSAGEDLIDYRIYGNTVQTGTPTPENPIVPSGCGERTENLFEVESDMLSSLNWDLNPPLTAIYFINYKLSDAVTQELKKGQHTCSIFEHFTDGYTPNLLVCAFTPTLTDTVGQEYRILTNQGKTFVRTFDFSKWQDIYLIIGYGNGFSSEQVKQSKIDELFANWEISIVEGSTAPTSYIPYGYKLPMTSAGRNVDIYLGESQTTRRIKKLVLTGEEQWYFEAHAPNRTVCRMLINASTSVIGFCSHIMWKSNYSATDYNRIIISMRGYERTMFISIADIYLAEQTLSGFKSYLAAQYAAGTPVTIWYVLAEPKTAVVNEPLMKIGDYADTVSMEQAGVSIPTAAGETIIDYNPSETPAVEPEKMYIKYKPQ